MKSPKFFIPVPGGWLCSPGKSYLTLATEASCNAASVRELQYSSSTLLLRFKNKADFFILHRGSYFFSFFVRQLIQKLSEYLQIRYRITGIEVIIAGHHLHIAPVDIKTGTESAKGEKDKQKKKNIDRLFN